MVLMPGLVRMESGTAKTADWVAETGPAVTLNGTLSAPVNPLAVAVSVSAAPALSIRRFANVATPFTAATLVVPKMVSVAPRVATVTGPVKPVAVFPDASFAVTCTAGVIPAPATVALGWTVNASRHRAHDGGPMTNVTSTACGLLLATLDVSSTTAVYVPGTRLVVVSLRVMVA